MTNQFEQFMQMVMNRPEDFVDMPHSVFLSPDSQTRHAAALNTACVLFNFERTIQRSRKTFKKQDILIEMQKYFRHDMLPVQVTDLRDPILIKFSSCPRGVFIDVMENARHKNGISIVSDSLADAILNFVKGLSCTRDMVHSRRMLVIENFDSLPVHSMRWFKRTFEKMTSSCWVLLTIGKLAKLDDTFMSQFCVIYVKSGADLTIQETCDGRNDNGSADAVRKMVSRISKASKCSDLVTAKIPRCVTAMGARGFMKSALSAALNMKVCGSYEQSIDLISRIVHYDVLQTWGKNHGSIGDDDEAFIDNTIMCTLLHIFCAMQQQQQQQR